MPSVLEDIAEGSDDNGFIISLLEDRLSTEDRKIRLSGVEGLLASQATVARITISDTEGTWLLIENAEIDWTRSALLRGRVEVDALTAERISIPRRPVPGPASLPDPSVEPAGFSVPELPVSVNLERLEIGEIELGEPVLGLEAKITANGSFSIANRALEAKLEINRLDGPGGRFTLDALIDDAGDTVDLSLDVSEPENGVFATLLDLDGRPALETAITASGTFAAFVAELDFRADGADLLDGRIAVNDLFDAPSFDAALTGRLRPLLPPAADAILAEEGTLLARGERRADGGFTLEEFELDSGGLVLSGTLRTASDGFPEAAAFTGRLRPQTGERVALPGVADGSVAGAALDLAYGTEARWRGSLALSDVRRGETGIATVALTAGGLTENLSDPATRRVTADINGTLLGLSSPDPALAETLEGLLSLVVALDHRAGEPLAIETAEISVGNVRIAAEGRYGADGFDGVIDAAAPDLSLFSALAGRPLTGGIDAQIAGRLSPGTGGFDVDLDGTVEDLVLGLAEVDPLLAGRTTMSGSVARTEAGFEADGFSIQNPQLQLSADGTYAVAGSDFTLSAALSDLGLVSDQGAGPLSLDARATGGVEALTLRTELLLPQGEVAGRAVADARLGIVARGSSLEDLTGTLDGAAGVDGTQARVTAGFALDGAVRKLSGMLLQVGRSEVLGTFAQGADGLIAGTAEIVSPDFGELARLAGTAAEGSGDLTVILSRAGGTQRARVSGRVDGFEAADLALGQADLDVTATDLFGRPLAAGRLTAAAAAAGGFTLEDLRLTSSTFEDAMRIALSASLQDGTDARLRADVTPEVGGATVDLESLDLSRDGLSAILTAPSTVRVLNGTVQLDPLRLEVGDGALDLAGSFADTLDLALTLDRFPLSVADLLAPDLDARGSLGGDVRVLGPPEAPLASFDVSGDGIGARPLMQAGIPDIALALQGESDGRLLTASGDLRAGDGLDFGVDGRLPLDPSVEGVDIALTLRRLSLALANGLAPELGIAGDVVGTANVTGSLAEPNPSFEITASGISVAPGRAAGLPDVTAVLTGAPEGRSVRVAGALTAEALMAAEIGGVVPLDPGADGLDLTLDLQELSLALAAGVLPDLAPAGRLFGRVDVGGSLTAPRPGFALSGEGLTVAPVAEIGLPPARLDLRGEALGERLVLEAGMSAGEALEFALDGSVPLEAGDLDLRVVLERLAFDQLTLPLGLDGALSGTARVTGPLAAPVAEVALDGEGLTTAPGRDADLPAAVLAATGRYADGRVEVDATLQATEMLSVILSGTAPLEAEGPLDLSLDLDGIDLRLADAVAPELGLSGRLDGQVEVGGSRLAPAPVFSVSATQVTTAEGRARGLPSAEVSAEGTAEDGVIDLSAEATAGPQLQMSVAGQVPVAGDDNRLSLAVELERLALSLTDAVAPDLGLRGTVSGAGVLRGSLAAPAPQLELVARDVSTATGRTRGLPAAEARLNAEPAAGGLAVEADLTAGDLVEISADGMAPLATDGPVDLTLTLERAALDMANAFLPELGLSGEVSGSAHLGGTLNAIAPEASLQIEGVTTAATRAAELPPLEGAVDLEEAAGLVTLGAEVSAGARLSLEAAGNVPMDPAQEGLDLTVDLGTADLAFADAVLPDLGLRGRVAGMLVLRGALAKPEPDFDLSAEEVTTAAGRQAGLPALAVVARGTPDGDVLGIKADATAEGGLDLSLAGRVPFDPEADGLDLTAEIRALDVALGRAVLPELAPEGQITGTARIIGALTAPRPSFDLAAHGLAVQPTRAFGIPPATLTLTGSESAGLVDLNADLVAGDAVAARITGQVPIDPTDARLSLEARVDRISLALANAVAPGQGIGGTASGSAAVTGALRDPAARFDVSAAGVTASALRSNGIDALSVEADGTFAGGAITFGSAVVEGPGGVRLTGSGRVPLDGGALDLNIAGDVPLALADVALARSQVQLDGTLGIDAAVGGPLSAPDLSGSLRVRDGVVAVRSANLLIERMDVAARLQNRTVLIDTATGALRSGGDLRLSGSLGLGAGLPADLALQLTRARYTDGRIVDTII
ncbi:MAG: hypothetical protein AAFV96_00540, partial [Pseudomonadota bacterium]